jgi:Gamma-glutamyl cyclotransferase, AIG2-like
MPGSDNYVFGYGSLVPPEGYDVSGLTPNALAGYRRTWGVAMDNSQAIPGYKRYLDPESGTAPSVFVVFLNIVADAGGRVNGVIFPVSPDGLAALDRRERNYDRVEVSNALADPVAATVWTYAGSRAGVERCRAGLRAGRAVISRSYAESVRRGFARLGNGAVAEFEALTEPPPCPIVDLRRVDVP